MKQNRYFYSVSVKGVPELEIFDKDFQEKLDYLRNNNPKWFVIGSHLINTNEIIKITKREEK